jgi:hypothetical protein
MYVSNFVRTVRSHWVLVLSGLLMTVGLCVAATVLVPPTYQADASVLLLPPRSADGTGENQYLNLGGLQPTTDAVSRAMTDSDVQKQLADAGATGAYVINTDPTTNGPVLLVSVTDASRAATLNTLKLVLDRLPIVIADLQEKVSVPVRSRLTSTVIAQDRTAGLVLKSRLRVLAAAIGLGLALTFGGVVFLDSRAGQLENGRRRRAEPVEPEAEVAERTVIRGAGDAAARVATTPSRQIERVPVPPRRPAGYPVRAPRPADVEHPASAARADVEHPVRPHWPAEVEHPVREPRPADIEHAETVRLPTWKPAGPTIRTGDRTGSG